MIAPMAHWRIKAAMNTIMLILVVTLPDKDLGKSRVKAVYAKIPDVPKNPKRIRTMGAGMGLPNTINAWIHVKIAIPATEVILTGMPLSDNFSARNPRQMNPAIMAMADQDNTCATPSLENPATSLNQGPAHSPWMEMYPAWDKVVKGAIRQKTGLLKTFKIP